MTTFEFRVPILPEPSFYSNVKLAALSLAKLGGSYASAPIVVSVGGQADIDMVKRQNRWSSRYPVVWRAVPDDVADRTFSSGADRYEEPPRTDVVILMDADACLMQPLEELLAALSDRARPTIAAVSAHFSPFSRDGSENDVRWRELLDSFGFVDAPLCHEYSMADGRLHGHCPAYFNYGFVAFNRGAFTKIQRLIRPLTLQIRERSRHSPQEFFSAQLALSLAILAAGVEPMMLGPEYNCPNSDEMLAHGLRDASEIRVMHYLRKELFDRHNFLCDEGKFRSFGETVFESPILRAFQRHVWNIQDVFYVEGERV